MADLAGRRSERKVVKKIKISILRYFLPALILLFMLYTTAKADGAGTMIFYFPKEAAGLELRMYKVAEYDLETFTYTEDFRKNPETLLHWNNAEEMQTAADTLSRSAVNENIEGVTGSVPRDGRLTFNGLSDGLYLIRQTESHTKYQMLSALVVVPCRIDTGETTRYVEVYPKIEEKPAEPTPEISEKPDISETPDNSEVPEISESPKSGNDHSGETTKTSRYVKTGDNTPIGFYVGLGLVALCICGVLYRKKKK